MLGTVPEFIRGDKGGILITGNRFNGFVQFAGLRLLPNPLERTRFYDFLLEHH